MSRFALPDLAGARRILTAALAVSLAVGVMGVAGRWSDIAGQLGDTDDALRLALVRALLAGQGWFDLHVARLQPPAGMDSHWSRLIDGGLALLIAAFRFILSPAAAELAARILWPLLWLALAAAAALAVARRLDRTEGTPVVLIGGILLSITLPAHVQFQPGRIDHHNAQIALLLVATAGLLHLGEARRAGWLAGVASGLQLAVGLEALPLLALIAAMAAIRLALRPALGPAVRGYGLGLAGTTLVAHLAQSGPRAFETACDALGANLVGAVIAGGLGLAAAAALAPRLGAAARWAVIAVAGGLAAAPYATAEPACLAGPFAGLDPRLGPVWLDRVAEMKSWPALLQANPRMAITLGVCPVLALLALVPMLACRRRDAAWIAIAVLLGSASLAMLLVGAMRNAGYALWLGMPVLAASLAALARRLRLRGLVPIAAFTCLASPLVATLALLALMPPPGERSEAGRLAQRACFADAAYAPLAALPPGRVLNDIDLGSFILADTPHAVMAAPYHRMAGGILASFDALAATPGADEAAVRALGIDYIVTCAPLADDQPWPEGALRRRLAAGAVPAWLAPVPADGPLQILRVRP